MMIVGSVDTADYAGAEVYRYSGDVYAVKGEGAWPQSAFLGAIELHQVGAGTWMSPLDGDMVVGCPLDEGGDPAEWGFNTTL